MIASSSEASVLARRRFVLISRECACQMQGFRSIDLRQERNVNLFFCEGRGKSEPRITGPSLIRDTEDT